MQHLAPQREETNRSAAGHVCSQQRATTVYKSSCQLKDLGLFRVTIMLHEVQIYPLRLISETSTSKLRGYVVVGHQPFTD